MPFSINGFGTSYYGQRDFKDDMSFITTEWIIALFIPIIPFRSHRVIRAPQNDQAIVVYTSEGYHLVSKVPLCWPQVVATYLFTLAGFLWVTAIAAILIKAPINWERFGLMVIVSTIFIAAAPLILLLWYRGRKLRLMTTTTRVRSSQPPNREV